MPNLQELPTELHLHIASYLEACDLMHFKNTDRLLHDHLDQHVYTQAIENKDTNLYIFSAVKSHNTTVVEKLLQHGLNPYLPHNPRIDIPNYLIDLAISCESPMTLRLLLERGVRPPPVLGATEMYFAVVHFDSDPKSLATCLKMLLEFGAEINPLGADGKARFSSPSILFELLKLGKEGIPIIRSLISAGMKLEQFSHQGLTLMDCALQSCGHAWKQNRYIPAALLEFIKLLLRSGAHKITLVKELHSLVEKIEEFCRTHGGKREDRDALCELFRDFSMEERKEKLAGDG